MRQDVIWRVLRSYGADAKLILIRILQSACGNAKAAVRCGKSLGEWFQQEKDVRQGDPISPLLFIVYLECAMQSIRDSSEGTSVHGRLIS